MTPAEWLASVTAHDVRVLGVRDTSDNDGPGMGADAAAWYDDLRVREVRVLVSGCEALAYFSTAMRALCGDEWEPHRAVWHAAVRMRWANE